MWDSNLSPLDIGGELAQLGERRLCKPEVTGSIPVFSTNMYYVYILKSLKDGKLYTGVTNNPDRRLQEHNSGKNSATRYRRPFILIHTECFVSKGKALQRERYLKTPKGSFEKFQIWQQSELHQKELAQLRERA
jgi:putative endonuclease